MLDAGHKYIDHLFHDAFETELKRTLMVRSNISVAIDAQRGRRSVSRRARKVQEWPCSPRGVNRATSKFLLDLWHGKNGVNDMIIIDLWHCHILDLTSYALGTAMLETTP